MSSDATNQGTTMKAIVQDEYGTPDVLELRDIDKPAVRDHEVRVRVRAVGIHVGDLFGVRGAPFLIRVAGFGLLRPKVKVRGFDAAGHVDAIGGKVTRFQSGDEVFGWCEEALAEYVVAGEDHWVSKPDGLPFEQAAAVPTSAFAALQAMRDAGQVQPGQKVLIIGASGGVGSFAVQIAKMLGAEVTGVCSTKNLDLVRSMGADHVIDYTREDFAQNGRQYDLILDNVENRPMSDCRRALTPEGTLILNSGTEGSGIGFLIRNVKPLLVSPFVRQKLCRYLSKPNHEDLVVLKELLESGEVTPILDRTYPLAETPEAFRYIGEGHARGKVVITVRAGTAGPASSPPLPDEDQ